MEIKTCCRIPVILLVELDYDFGVSISLLRCKLSRATSLQEWVAPATCVATQKAVVIAQ